MANIAWLIETLIPIIILIPLSALLLFASTKLFKTKDQRYLTALKMSAVVYLIFLVLGAVLAFIPNFIFYLTYVFIARFIVLGVIAWLLVKRWYDLDVKQSLFVFGVWYLGDIVLNWILNYAYNL